MGIVKIRKGKPEDLERILEIFQSAKAYMRSKGNLTQWSDGYPGAEHILKDMKNGHNYVGIDESGKISMVFSFIIGEDWTYKVIEDGEWLNENPYGTIHRIASDGTSRGALRAACDFCFKLIDTVRTDTHKDNKPMQKALADLGFKRCGRIYCRDGTAREAYQKDIHPLRG